MRYMVIERFKDGDSEPVYKRFDQQGRMLPVGLYYIDSWLSADKTHCFQLMETDEPALFDIWTAAWNDLVEFELVPLGDKPFIEPQ